MRSAGQVSANLPRHVSSWTPAAYGQPRGSDEEEKDELLSVPIQLRTPAQWARLQELIGASSQARRRKRKKRRKRRLPRAPRPRPVAWHHGRYGPEGLLRAHRRLRQLHGQGWFYWLRYTSCVFPLGCWQARDVRHHGRYGPKGFLRDSARRRHRQWPVYVWFCWILHLALSSLSWCAGPDAWHHGRYEPDVLRRVLIPAVACARQVLLVHALWYVPFVVGRLVMLGITAGMDHTEGYVVLCGKLRKIRRCSSSTRSSSSSSWFMADFHGLTVHSDH